MKKYVFSFSTSSLDFNSREYKIEAPGMMDALMKIKHIKADVEAEISSNVHIHFKGIAYSE